MCVFVFSFFVISFPMNEEHLSVGEEHSIGSLVKSKSVMLQPVNIEN